jgi:hypothetical protein
MFFDNKGHGPLGVNELLPIFLMEACPRTFQLDNHIVKCPLTPQILCGQKLDDCSLGSVYEEFYFILFFLLDK